MGLHQFKTFQPFPKKRFACCCHALLNSLSLSRDEVL